MIKIGSLVISSFMKTRFLCLYLCFTTAHDLLYNSQREPEEPDDPTKGRDVFNEKPSADELLAVSDIGKSVTTSLPDNVVSYSFICIYQINIKFRIGLRWISFSMGS